MSQLGSDYISMESLGQSQPGGLVMAPDGNYMYSASGPDVNWSRTSNGGYYMDSGTGGAPAAAGPATSTPTANNPMLTNGQPNFLGANLNPQYYGNYMDKLPANMPGGGGAIIDNYGAAPWVQNWNTGSQVLSGPFATTNAFNEQYYLQNNPDVAAAIQRGDFTSALQHYNMYGKSEGRLPNVGSGSNYGAAAAYGGAPGPQSPWAQGGQGYYQPYQMISGGGGYGIPPIGTGPFSFNQGGSYYGNPYQNAAQGSNLNISDAFNNARWDQYQDYITANPASPGRGTLIGGKEYNFAAPWQDSSTGSPFAGAQQAQGNSAGWQSGDTGPTTNQFTNPGFKVAGGGSVTGNAAPEQAADPGQLWSREMARMFKRYNEKYQKYSQPLPDGRDYSMKMPSLDRMMDRFDQRSPGFSDLYNQYNDWYTQNQGMLDTKNRLLYRGLNANPIYMGQDLSGYTVAERKRPYFNHSIWDAPQDPREAALAQRRG